MTDKEKFEGFMQKMISNNESQYGAEARECFGNDLINASNAKLTQMTKEQWQRTEDLRIQYESLLKSAFEQGDPSSELAQNACDLHRQWICMYWKEGTYTKEAHKGLTEMYVEDERFTSYYDKIAVGCAQFLKDAMTIYLQRCKV